jgi:hypothetical protein
VHVTAFRTDGENAQRFAAERPQGGDPLDEYDVVLDAHLALYGFEHAHGTSL